MPALQRVGEAHHLAGVVTAPDARVGRSKQLVPPPVKQAALARGIGPIFQPPTLRGAVNRNPLLECAPEALVVVAYGRLLPGGLLDAPPRGAINLHFSLLPRHRGASPVQYTLWKGDAVAGVSTMLMDRGLDTGPLLLQRSEPVRAQDTVRELGDRLARLGADLLLETLAGLEAGTLSGRPQPEEGVSWTAPLTKDLGLLRFTWTAMEIERRLRAFGEWPHLVCGGVKGTLRLVAAEALGESAPPDMLPGVVWRRAGEALDLVCGAGSVLRVNTLQPAGGRAMPAVAALSGRHVVLGQPLVELAR